MGMGKHTPGPWEMRREDDDLVIRMGTALKSQVEFEVQHEIRWQSILFGISPRSALGREVIANFRLATNSPDLLAACQAQQAAEDHHKACEDCDDGYLCTEGCRLYGHAKELRAKALAKTTEPVRP